ncbi:uncharacterized protein A4U43_C05F34160 [Asparagus officinalis]|uniref:Uncharacterized protein n=1 Tax=Asparagus officinalis TaxID=4686 RepID=A0A5P1F1A2_ASPOF|nr:uncharacterized protein A4U43_C05F34160 [Asparagus officinalis]
MFEIPKADNGFILRKSSKTRREVEQMMTIPESMPEEAPTNSLGDDDFSNKDELSALKKGASLDFQPNFAFQNDVEQIKCQVQQLVDDVRIMKEEDLKKGNAFFLSLSFCKSDGLPSQTTSYSLFIKGLVRSHFCLVVVLVHIL